MADQSTAQYTWDLLTCEVDVWGDRIWRDENGELHRENGPAVIASLGTQCWYKHGKCHREDGPAVIHHDGRVEYRIDGIELTVEQFNDWKRERRLPE